MGSTVEELSPVAPDAVQRGGHLPITNDAKRVQAVPYPLREEYTQDTLQPWQISLEDELGLNKLGFRSAELTKVPEWIHLPGQDYVDNAWNAMIGYVWNLVSPGALKDYPKVTNLDVMGFIAGPKAVEPELEDPDALSREDVEQFILEMNELLDHIRDMNADMDEEVDFEQLIVSMYKSQIEETESQLDENKEKIVETNQKRKSINADRQAKMDQLLKETKHHRLWGKFDLAVTGAAMTGAAASVSSGWGAVALLFGAGVIGDELLGDPVKGSLAHLISGGDMQAEEKWLERMRLGAGLVSALTMLALGQQNALTPMIGAAKGVTKGMQGWHQYQSNELNAAVMQLSEKATENLDSAKKHLTKNKKLVTTVGDFFRQLSNIQQNRREAYVALMR